LQRLEASETPLGAASGSPPRRRPISSTTHSGRSVQAGSLCYVGHRLENLCYIGSWPRRLQPMQNPDINRSLENPHLHTHDNGRMERPDDHAEHRHSHTDGGHSHHLPATFDKAFAIGITLNIAYVVAQVLFGLFAHSLALLADAGHNLGDVLGLGMAWGASRLAQCAPTLRYTYGFRRSSILASLANAILLLVAVGGITWEAIRRFWEPTSVAGATVTCVAAVGIVINAVTALLFASGRKGDLNIKGAFVHMAADAIVSAGVVVAGIVILLSGWWWLDPVVSLVINAVIVWGTWGLLRDSMDMALDAVPPGVDVASVQNYFRSLSGVTDFHHLHIWSLSTTQAALTVHLVKPQTGGDDDLLETVNQELSERFGIGHATIQFERQVPVQGCPSDKRN
jgi:cobalt-zinc-cadmium efflux system protein